ncbi:hypothetical protein DH2020_004992 [Rehmannia glutinosa]|uniref:F-box domain-containing protein n=1 Tax=Rehmannia glutinosa TaxID=99300 RepID=A0ABR0XRB3_REHGL
MVNQVWKRRRMMVSNSMDMDKISNLPQPILHHILSFLSQKEAVQTCVLSKSWRYVWSARPAIDFLEDFFNGNTKHSATIDAPNILVFNYEGNISTSICFRTTSSKWKSNIFLRNYADFEYHASSWFHKLSELLKSLSQSVISLKLIQDCRIFRQIEDPPDINIYGGFDKALVIEHLSLRGHYSSSSFKAFLNCLFRVCRPRNISQCWYLDAHNDWQRKEEKLIEFLVEILLIERDMRQHFWRQDLEEVSMDENGHEWHPGEGIKFRFRLKWRELS